jgi:hypothetical protein
VYLGDSSSLAYQVFFHHFVGVTVHFGVDWFPQSSYYNGEKAEDGSHFTGTPWSDLENGVCSLGCSATAYVRIRYQQLERIRTAAPAGAIAVAYFALRWLIRVQGLLSAPSSCKYGTTQSLPQCEYLIIYYVYYAGGCSSTDLLRLLVAQNYLLYPYCDYILGRLHLYVVRSSSRWEFLCWVSCWYRSGAILYTRYTHIGDHLCTYQQLECIRTAAAAGAIAVAYFAFRCLIRVHGRWSAPYCRYGTTQSPA